MRHDRIALALAALLAGCSRPAPPPPTPSAASRPEPAMCRVGPDGGPVVADRGIGGTGGPARLAERGIGGTGGPALANAGTGIVGVITGFASVCLAGQEVALAPDVPVSIDQRPASADALRAGQVVAVQAAGEGGQLSAARIVVRNEVSGPVERVDGDRLRVAGQDVVVGPATWGVRPQVGEWVAVSGLRRPDGALDATRLDQRSPGDVLVRGTLREDGGRLHIGALPVAPAPGLAALAGQEVTATGPIVAGTLIPDTVMPDLLAMDPAAFFGPAVGVFYLEGFAVLEAGRVRLGRGFAAPAPGLDLGRSGRAVLRFERGEGGLRAVGLGGRPGFEPGRFGPAPRFEPAPVPNRAIGGPEGRFGRAGPGPGRDGAGQRDGFRPSALRRRGDAPGFGPDAGGRPR